MVKKTSLSERMVDSREEKAITPNVMAFSPDECYDHFESSIELLKKQFEVADRMLSEGNMEGCKNIWRSQIVFLDGILDFYIHELSKFGIERMFLGEWPKTPKYKNMQIPMNIVEDGLRSNPNSCQWLLNHSVEIIKSDTYLSYESIKDQLNFLGISLIEILNDNFYSTCEFTGRNRNDGLINGKEWIRDLFNRRNEISHQLDRSLVDSSENDISKEYVEDFIKKVELLVEKIHEKACDLSVGARNQQ